MCDMRILQINTFDVAGGAERISYQLRFLLQQKGYNSKLIVGKKFSEDENIFEFLSRENKLLDKLSSKIRGLPRFKGRLFLSKMLHEASLPILGNVSRILGIEDFEFPDTSKSIDLVFDKIDICHAHNLHKDYFDLRQLPRLSQKYPFLITLHDAWLLSGHCAHSFECNRWMIGCGQCPDLKIYPEISHDATAFNWNRKQKIFQNSSLYIASPSQWLLNKVNNSILKPAIQISKVIPNGIDLSVFHPASKVMVRQKLGFSTETKIILAVGNVLTNNPWKDYSTLLRALQIVGQSENRNSIIFIVIGQDSPSYLENNIDFRFLRIDNNSNQIAQYYQAADVYIHASKADTFPTTIIEAMACGCPTIATNIGGIPEQIVDGKTGFLVPLADYNSLAKSIINLLNDENLQQTIGNAASEVTLKKFDQEIMVKEYIAFYEEILMDRSNTRTIRSN